jgi:hypothetical protein
VIARLRASPKAPLAVAGILSTPLFFVALMATSLGVEEPTVRHVLSHGQVMRRLGDPSNSTEAEIWLLTLAATAFVVLVGVAAMLIGRGGVILSSLAAIGVTAGLLAPLDTWAKEHTALYPLGVDLIAPGTSADVFLRGEWESTARHTAVQLGVATIVMGGIAIAVFVLFEVRRRRGVVRPVPPPPPEIASGGPA